MGEELNKLGNMVGCGCKTPTEGWEHREVPRIMI